MRTLVRLAALAALSFSLGCASLMPPTPPTPSAQRATHDKCDTLDDYQLWAGAFGGGALAMAGAGGALAIYGKTDDAKKDGAELATGTVLSAATLFLLREMILKKYRSDGCADLPLAPPNPSPRAP